jgi:hypothetical protein
MLFSGTGAADPQPGQSIVRPAILAAAESLAPQAQRNLILSSDADGVDVGVPHLGQAPFVVQDGSNVSPQRHVTEGMAQE